MSDDIPKMRKPNDPDQIAVALSYAGVEDTAPEILASGRGAIAEQILQIAFDQGIRVREDADLAQVLGLLEVGEEIPVEAFAAVAEILAYVYRANGEDMPGVDVPLKPKDTPKPQDGASKEPVKK